MLDPGRRRGVGERLDVIDQVSHLVRLEVRRRGHRGPGHPQQDPRVEWLAVPPPLEDPSGEVAGPDRYAALVALLLDAVALARVPVTGGALLEVQGAAARHRLRPWGRQVVGYLEGRARLGARVESLPHLFRIDLLAEFLRLAAQAV